MKKIISALILAAALLVTGCGLIPGRESPKPSEPLPPPTESAQPSEPIDTEEGAVADYFPFKADVYMSYLGTGMEFAGFETWVDYMGNGAIQIRTDNTGITIASVYIIEDGALKEVFTQEDVYYRNDFTAEREKSEILIMEPIAVGTAWQLEDGTQRSITATDADVTVPYGTYKALEVTTDYEGSIVKDYYAKGVGLVKSEFTTKETPPYIVTSELEKYTEGSPHNENAQVYYPDFNNDRLAYINQGFEFHTGDSILPKLEEVFKNPPADSELGRVMTDSASIRSIALDISAGVVTIDFNKAFVTEMNAGTTMEGMILGSIANTLGSYFLVEKVQITLEGEPYESGHMLFRPGEYLPFNPEDAVEYQG